MENEPHRLPGGDAWFAGEPRNDRERRYLAALRGIALDRPQFEAIPSSMSSTFSGWIPLTVGLEVPALTCDRRFLWVSYWTRPDGQQQLQGAWGDQHPLDDWTADLEDDLTVAGVEASPEEFGT